MEIMYQVVVWLKQVRCAIPAVIIMPFTLGIWFTREDFIRLIISCGSEHFNGFQAMTIWDNSVRLCELLAPLRVRYNPDGDQEMLMFLQI